VIVRDIATDPLWDHPGRDVVLAGGLRACWSIPVLSTSGAVLGTFANYYRESREPSAEELRTMGIASHLAGIAIERSRNVEAVAQSTRLLQQVLETLPVGVWVIGPSGRIIYGNAAGQQLWGGVRYVGIDGFDQFKGWWLDSGRAIRPDEWAGARAVRDGEVSLNELIRIQGFDGSEHIILNSAVPIMGAGGSIEGAIVLNQDVTEQRAAEEALRRSEEQLRQAQKMEAVGQLAGGIAHDFNNLLTAILSYCELLLEEIRQGDPIRGDIEQIRQAGQRAAGLTRQLLAFSRRQVLQPKVLSLNAVVESTEGMLRRLVGADIVLEIRSEPALGHVLADPGQIEQVLVNLVVNARDAMPRGGRILVATSNLELKADSLMSHSWCVTPAWASTRPTTPASSSRSSRPRSPARAPAWDSRPSTGSYSRAADMSPWRARRAKARPSPCSCPGTSEVSRPRPRSWIAAACPGARRRSCWSRTKPPSAARHAACSSGRATPCWRPGTGAMR
jgi:signal transduction histidine kinase